MSRLQTASWYWCGQDDLQPSKATTSQQSRGQTTSSVEDVGKSEESTTVSQVVEEIDSGSPLPKIIGGTPTATAKLAGLELKCLIDFGYMVTLISETFYKQKLESVCGGLKGGGKILMPCGANRLEIPYLGYQELDVHVEVVTVPKCRVLVFKDSSHCSAEQKET